MNYINIHTSIQDATAYIVYMIIGSYYTKCKAKNMMKEKALYMHYKQLGPKNQIRIERNVERIFLRMRDIVNTDLAAEVAFSCYGDAYIVYFHTGFQNINVYVDKEGMISIEVHGCRYQ